MRSRQNISYFRFRLHGSPVGTFVLLIFFVAQFCVIHQGLWMIKEFSNFSDSFSHSEIALSHFDSSVVKIFVTVFCVITHQGRDLATET